MGSYGSDKPTEPTEPSGVTAQLSHWISNLQLSDVPPPVRERAKYQLLDGVACALVGAHVPWSEKYVEATAEYEPDGEYSVIGWDKVRKSSHLSNLLCRHEMRPQSLTNVFDVFRSSAH